MFSVYYIYTYSKCLVYIIYIHSIRIVYIIYLQYLICQKQSDKIAIRGLVLVRVEHESQTQQTLQVSSWWQLPTGTISSICHQLSSSRCSSGMVGTCPTEAGQHRVKGLGGRFGLINFGWCRSLNFRSPRCPGFAEDGFCDVTIVSSISWWKCCEYSKHMLSIRGTHRTAA